MAGGRASHRQVKSVSSWRWRSVVPPVSSRKEYLIGTCALPLGHQTVGLSARTQGVAIHATKAIVDNEGQIG
eukprot:947685-Pyramimonas_sp.AAC.1